LDHTYVQLFMTVITVYILFADDIKMICTTQEADDIFSAICVAIMSLFSIEFGLSCYAQKDYICGFYFWLDFISIISMLLDISWFYSFLIALVTDSSAKGKLFLFNILFLF
jgi:hypothetical protein